MALRRKRLVLAGYGTSSSARAIRDPRVDFFRGAALLIICTDHIRGNWFAAWTPMNFGFSDMAEVFVFLSGYVCGLSYERRLAADGFAATVLRVARRCVELACAAVLTTVALTVLIGDAALLPSSWMATLGMASTVSDVALTPHDGLLRACCAAATGILMLYIIFLCALPIMLLTRRIHGDAPAVISLAVYFITQLTVAGRAGALGATAGSLNPLTWQLLFFLGVALALEGSHGRFLWRARPAAVLVAFAMLDAAAFVTILRPDLAAIWAAKSHLPPLRVLHFFCLLLVIEQITCKDGPVWSSWLMRPLIVCGRNPLATFCVSWIACALATVILTEHRSDYGWQIGVNLAAWTACIFSAWACEILKPRRWRTGGCDPVRRQFGKMAKAPAHT